MHRQLIVALLALGLLATMAGAAAAAVPSWPHEWPRWDEVTGTFSAKVVMTETATGWDYTVNVDPAHAYQGWAIQAFVVYAGDVTTQHLNGWGEYDGGEPAGWTKNGGWMVDKYPGPPLTTAAFGWVTWSGAFVYSGNSATFHAINLPDGYKDWGQKFAVLVVPPSEQLGAMCDNTFWAPADHEGGPPNETPEPGSLALLTLGAGAVFGALKRRTK